MEIGESQLTKKNGRFITKATIFFVVVSRETKSNDSNELTTRIYHSEKLH
jgi:hypothetical protein